MNARYVPVILAGLAVLCLVAMGTIANAQQMKCAPRDVVTKGLADQFQEVQAARGPLDDRHIMELFISPAGSWTILITNDQKISCIRMGHTEGFEFIAPEVPKPGQGS